MVDTLLTGLRVLVVEDNYLIASAIEEELRDAGATIVGPVSNIGEAMRLAKREAMDSALLDIDLRGEQSFSIAHTLARRGIPHFFVTGYGVDSIPVELRHVPLLFKPFGRQELIDMVLGRAA